ncbi:hypothetical protein C5B77_06325 [Aeromonas salmonicida]|nr:hypothetical protein C5B77_06325 [Aeromonas salmonicida]
MLLITSRQSGNQAIRQSGNQAIRQSGNQAIRQSGLSEAASDAQEVTPCSHGRDNIQRFHVK